MYIINTSRQERGKDANISFTVCLSVCLSLLSVCVCWHIVLRSSDRQTDAYMPPPQGPTQASK